MSCSKPLVLTILDGLGYREAVEANAVAQAKKPNIDALLKNHPHVLIRTDGPFVGLPDGQFGNSEVGHLNIGSGRVLLMDVMKLDVMVESGELFNDPTLKASMAAGKASRLHLFGLTSQGGVHGQLSHLIALIEMAKREGVTDLVIHCFMDGRDTPPNSGAAYLDELEAAIARIGLGRIATVSGRYYAMDRDKRWERTERAFNAMALGQGETAPSAKAAVQASYDKGVTDEFVDPTVIDGAEGLIRDGDACLFYNYRADRARQITIMLNERRKLHYTTMTQYDKTYPYPVVLPPVVPTNILGEVISRSGLKQLRVAETEKYPHVTYFFNGGNEKPFEGETREMVPSPKVATYDLQPEMSAAGVCDVVVKAIEGGEVDVIVVNFANPDMVGHTGSLPAAIKAVEAVDGCVGRIKQALDAKGGTWIVTADHGNCELMVDPETGQPHTYHTTNPVPFIVAAEGVKKLRQGGALRDIAPTMLHLLGLPKPEEMSGESLIGD